MTITNGYATLNEYKAWIAARGLAGSVGTDASDDTVIEDLIEAVSRYIDTETGERFYTDSAAADYYYTSKELYEMELPAFSAITTVSVDYNNARSYTALASGDWEGLPDNYAAEGLPIMGLAILPTSAAWFPTWRKAVKVTGKRGWASAPDDIKDACLSIVQNLYALRSGQATNTGRVTITGGGVVIRPDDVPGIAQTIIKRYRKLT